MHRPFAARPMMGLMQKRLMTPSPPLAFSIAPRSNRRVSQSSIASAIIVARLRVPGRFPAGLPDRPLRKGALAEDPSVFVADFCCICSGFAAKSAPILTPLLCRIFNSVCDKIFNSVCDKPRFITQ
jgi:hypothetical protein